MNGLPCDYHEIRGSRVRVGSIVVTRIMGGNIELSTSHKGGMPGVVERADIDDAIEALKIAARWPR
jgi:hypothetical protein